MADTYRLQNLETSEYLEPVYSTWLEANDALGAMPEEDQQAHQVARVIVNDAPSDEDSEEQ